MFNKTITNSAKFIKMPPSTQTLYFHLVMNADDDGVVEAYTIMKILGSADDDIKILSAKNFVSVLNDDLVTFVINWHDHNHIRADRKINSKYKDLLVKSIPEIQLVKPIPRSDINDNSKTI